MALSKEKFNKYLYIENNTVYTKIPAKIEIDLNEFKDIEEDSDFNEGLDEVASDIYEIPGFFALQFPDKGDEIKFFFPYNIFLIDTDESEVKNGILTIWYEENSPIFYAKFLKEETNIKVLDRIFENGLKYLSNDLGLLVNAVWKQLKPTMNIPYHHLETILTNLFIVYEDGEYKPVRLSKEQEYKKEYATNTKKSAHLLNNTLGFLYGYSNEALLTAAINGVKEKEESFLEKMIKGVF